jgi:hypothetical protein
VQREKENFINMEFRVHGAAKRGFTTFV